MKKIIKAQEIPFEELKNTIGMSETEFLNLPPKILDKVMSGRLSPLMHVKVDTGNFLAEGLMKFGFTKEPDGSVRLKLYPMEKNLKYDQDIVPEEMQRLKKGEAVLKEVKRDGITQQMYIQLDRETNNVIEMKATALNIPETINGIELGVEQRQRIREGKPVQIEMDNVKMTVGVDLEDLTNLRVLNGDLKEWQEQKLMLWDRLSRGTATGWWKTSENEWKLKQFNLEREFGQSIQNENTRSMGLGMHYGLGLKK